MGSRNQAVPQLDDRLCSARIAAAGAVPESTHPDSHGRSRASGEVRQLASRFQTRDERGPLCVGQWQIGAEIDAAAVDPAVRQEDSARGRSG